MKILIIAKNVGRIAPGIVAERLIKGLSEIHDLDVLSTDYDPSFKLTKVNKVIRFKSWKLNSHISKFFISFFSIDPLDIYVAKKTIYSCEDNYDLILSFISSNHYASLMMGNSLSKRFKLRHFTILFDAIPAPAGWLKKDSFYRGLKIFIARNLAKVNGLFSSNQKMLDYQLSTFQKQHNIVTGVVYCPTNDAVQCYDYVEPEKNMFLFTGGLYGPRTPKYVIAAFQNILKEFPDSTLEFVGSVIESGYLLALSTHEKEKIIVHPFTKDLSPFYKRATALIDIDSDLDNDVFLSSKISNYIMINRVIISQTGEDSPSRTIFKNISSILQCNHDIEELTHAMKNAIKQVGRTDFNDRAKVISLFSLKNVITELNKKITV